MSSPRGSLPQMLARNWGRVIFISSESGLQIPTESIAYGAVKAAVIATARGLAEINAGTGIDTEAIRLAVESMNRDGRDYPPNQAQFVALARQFVRRGAHRLAITDGRRDPPPGGFESIRSILKRQ